MAQKNERYWLQVGDLLWQEATADQFIQAEREAGFRPKDGGGFATGGFSGGGIRGKITYGEIPEKAYSFPVWNTQGGGLVREINGTYIFVEAPPNGMGLGIGDELPEEWGLIPANKLASLEMDSH